MHPGKFPFSWDCTRPLLQLAKTLHCIKALPPTQESPLRAWQLVNLGHLWGPPRLGAHALASLPRLSTAVKLYHQPRKPLLGPGNWPVSAAVHPSRRNLPVRCVLILQAQNKRQGRLHLVSTRATQVVARTAHRSLAVVHPKRKELLCRICLPKTLLGTPRRSTF